MCRLRTGITDVASAYREHKYSYSRCSIGMKLVQVPCPTPGCSGRGRHGSVASFGLSHAHLEGRSESVKEQREVRREERTASAVAAA